MAEVICPAYIGRIGRMTPTPCIQEISVDNEQRAVFGGGAGSLSPRRVRVQGPGGRSWKMSRERWLPHENSALFSLARKQSLYGGSYRVIPCDALEHNLLTPRATEELWDWTGLSVGPIESFPFVDPGEAWGAAMMGRASLGNAANSPRVPLPKVGRLWAKVHLAGVGELVLRYRSASGATTDHVMPFSIPQAGGLKRFGGTELMLGGHVSAEVLVRSTVEAPVYFAWPSIAYADHPYVTGRGCDSAYISMPSRTALADYAEGFSYDITEVGV